MASKHSPFPHPSKTSSQSSHGHDSRRLPRVPGAAGSSVFCSLSPALGELPLLGVPPFVASRGSRGAVQPTEGKASTSPVCVRALSTVLSN